MATMPTSDFETPRLRLREFTVDDVDALVELDSDPAVMRFITGGPPTSREEIEGVVLPHWLGLPAKTPGYGFWAAEDRESGQFIGWFHLRLRDGHPVDEPELGYRLRRQSWGAGLATEGSRVLIDHAFTVQGAARVVAETMAVNVASRRVMEKAGMSFVRTFLSDWPFRIPGDDQGDVEYAIERADWERARRI